MSKHYCMSVPRIYCKGYESIKEPKEKNELVFKRLHNQMIKAWTHVKNKLPEDETIKDVRIFLD